MSSVVEERKSLKKLPKSTKKLNNKPMKVVYISNPMKFKTSAAEFRALVQELTGQDAEIPADPNNNLFHGGGEGEEEHEDVVGGNQTTTPVHHSSSKIDDDGHNNYRVMEVPQTVVAAAAVDDDDDDDDVPCCLEDQSCFDDDVFVPQMLENYPGRLLPSSSLLYES